MERPRFKYANSAFSFVLMLMLVTVIDSLEHEHECRTIALRSVQIRLREWKGVLDQFDPRFRILSDDHFHYVKAEKYIRVLQHTEPGERAA